MQPFIATAVEDKKNPIEEGQDICNIQISVMLTVRHHYVNSHHEGLHFRQRMESLNSSTHLGGDHECNVYTCNLSLSSQSFESKNANLLSHKVHFAKSLT